MEFDFGLLFWIAAAAMLPVMPFLLRRFQNVEVIARVVVMVRTKRVLPFFDRLARHGRIIDAITDFGILIGFGAIAVDSLWGRKMPRAKRALLFVASTCVMGLFFIAFDAMLGSMFSSAPFTRNTFWAIVLIFGVSGFAGFSIAALGLQASDILLKAAAGRSACPGVAPLIPGVEIPNVPITIPLYGWLVLLVILAVHEGMHGIAARRLGVAVKNAGVLLISFLPVGAFVEPDERQLSGESDRNALRIFAAGPTANILLLGVVLLVALGLLYGMAIFINPWANAMQKKSFGGLVIEEIDQNVMFCGEAYAAPAYGVLEEGQVIEAVNDTNITSEEKFASVLMINRYEPLSFRVRSADGSTSEETIAPNELGSFGIAKVRELGNPAYAPPWEFGLYKSARENIFGFLDWLFILSMLIAIVNFLPVAIFDGGRMASILLLPYFGGTGMNREQAQARISKIFLWVLLALIAVNAIPLFIQPGA